MSHNLATINGKEAMAYQGQTPWHKLGTRLASLQSVQAAMDAANLDWQVTESDLFLNDGRKVESRKAIIRMTDGNPILSTVGDGYQILQHTDIFRSLDFLCAEFGFTIESAGALGQGERVWMLFKMPDTTITVTPGDDVRGYLLATTGHDGTWAFQTRPTPIRVVCQNTLDMAVSSDSDFVRLYHTRSNKDRVGDAAKVIQTIVESFEKTGETFTSWAHRQMSAAEVITYVETLFPQDEKKPKPVIDARRKTIADLVWTGNGSDLARSSTNGEPNVWAVYNAVTEYFDHVRPAEAKSKAGANRANLAALFGQGAELKLQAMKLAKLVVAG